LLGCAAVRLYRLDHFSYWLDEILQVRTATEPPETFWKDLKSDGFDPPLDYLVVWWVERLEPADWVRKIPAVIWSLGGLAALFALVRRRAGQTAAFVTLAVLALAPFHVRYSQELRPYALGLLWLFLALLALDRFLERPGPARLALLYASSLAAAYTLYLAAVVLALAGGAIMLEDTVSPDPNRRRTARRSLAWSPIFAAALWVGYLPWWPVVRALAGRAAVTGAPAISTGRFASHFAFFAFASSEGARPGIFGFLYFALILVGLAIAVSRTGLRFLAVWSLGGIAAIEALSHMHPHYDAPRHWLPAAIAFGPLAALPLARLLEARRWKLAGAIAIAAILILDARSLLVYFRQGRPDWRVLAEMLRREVKSDERIFSENQWTQLCLGFYLRAREDRSANPSTRPVWNLDGEVARLTWSWIPGSRAWLVLAGGPAHDRLRRWAEIFPSRSVPAADGAIVRSLDPVLRDAAFARVPPESAAASPAR
jgi:dolichyl-phosphate-mannose-protein mannosyltransferase